MMQTKDELRSAVEQLRQTLAAEVPGNERTWAEHVASALVEVDRGLRPHAVGTPDDGPLAEVDFTRPTLARQSEALRREESKLLTQVRALRAEIRGAAHAFQSYDSLSRWPAASGSTAVPDFGIFRRQAEQLAERLEKAENAETDLVLESLNTDIGVGD